MSKRIFTTKGLTFNAAADNAALTSVSFMALKGQSNQLVDVLSIKVAGMAGVAVDAAFVWKRASTLETTPTPLSTASASDGFLLPIASALSSSVTAFIAATTGPIGSQAVTDATLDLSINGFGGLFNWQAAPGMEWKIIGTAAPGLESVLYNSSTAGGANSQANISIIYEPY
jgi:hypothetical protein